MGHVLGAVERLLDGLQQHHAGRGKQILALNADHRAEIQGVFRGLLGRSLLFFWVIGDAPLS
jgi:hypothetical protein